VTGSRPVPGDVPVVLPENPVGLAGLLPPELEPVCAAAVDALEIAAALEAAGISNRVAQTTFGRPDLFSMAEELYEARSGRSVPLEVARKTPRPGGREDLAVGLLFAAPALSIAVAARALHLVLPWWTLPLALTIGWSFGQALAGSALVLRNRDQDPAPAVLPSVLLATGAGGTAALIGVALGGGGLSAVLTVTVFCLFVTSLAVLSVYEEAGLIGLALAPSLLTSVAYLIDPSGPLRWAVLASVALTLGATLVLALLHARYEWWSPRHLTAHERGLIRTFFVYGGCCGVAVSVVTVVAQGAQGLGPLSLVALPVMLSLGVLEWQLHSFRSRATHALRTASSLIGFERRATGTFARSIGLYVVALSLISGAVVLLPVGAGLPLLSLAAEDAIGVTLFAGMVVSICSGLDVGVRSWTAGAAAFGVGLVVVHGAGLGGDRTALQAATLAGAMVAMLSMMSGAFGVLRLPFHYQG
jgi:hypothetical protein